MPEVFEWRVVFVQLAKKIVTFLMRSRPSRCMTTAVRWRLSTRPQHGRPVVTGVRWCPFGSDRLSALRQVVRDLDARGLPVVATLPNSAYSLVQLEAPELEPEELREAMRWRVKDLIDFPVEEAVIDVFGLPASRRPGAPELVYAVVAKSHEVDDTGQAPG